MSNPSIAKKKPEEDDHDPEPPKVLELPVFDFSKAQKNNYRCEIVRTDIDNSFLVPKLTIYVVVYDGDKALGTSAFQIEAQNIYG